jgi:hypothetical protein
VYRLLDDLEDGQDGGAKEDIAQELKDEQAKLLTKKVYLSFPADERKAPTSVELGLLAPVFTEMPAGVTIVPRNPAVAAMALYKNLVEANNKSKNSSCDDNIFTESEKFPSSSSKKGQGHERQPTPIYVLEVKKNIFVVLNEAVPSSNDEGEYLWEVENIRGKSICMYDRSSEYVRKNKLETDGKDPWVAELGKACLSSHL